MNKGLFELDDYKEYLAHVIRSRPKAGHGEKSRIAQALQCHVAYVSQVLNGPAQFSLEQAEMLNRYLAHSETESEYFLLLVLYGRAGTANLKEHYRKKVLQAQEQQLSLKNRLEFKKTLTLADQARYYSAWHFAAIHLLIAIPQFQTKDALYRRLKISMKRISETLNFFVECGLATEDRGSFKPGVTSIHLGNDSPMISQHHTNWRMQAIQSFEHEIPEELHYSSVVSIARADMPKIRKALTQAVEEVRRIVRDSKEDDLCCYSIDFFRVAAGNSS
ncbi:MAG: hypothetical protein A2428_09825 [Bdellovibrionales bacterium RIFOXYC1_FULL_54_43]|nr:MAG: hypothetical protein A2428_09825 [Bdellovibrionales bacterium RIFOXYC1_FULL_54_43]OFZ83286.1 MAG: hypothetical protein A2603_16305 [Bdellovibrionales bacterium RIFOXYD1_FULL_55_31]